VSGQIVNIPSYIVPVEKENQIEIIKKEKAKPQKLLKLWRKQHNEENKWKKKK
jgi:ribosomal protein S4